MEHTFGVWKEKWSMLRDMHYDDIDTHRDVVLAIMAILNYIRKKYKVDDAVQAADERYVPSVDHVDTSIRANK